MVEKRKGYFITFEGPECGGKTTQLKRVAEWLREEGLDVRVSREPGGTEIGEAIGNILRENAYAGMLALTEALLFQASRVENCVKIIRPSLEDNKIVLVDRFKDSSGVYQGMARGLGYDFIEELNERSTQGLTPDTTLLLDLEVKETLRRLSESGRKERIDAEPSEFHQVVRDGYLEIAELDNRESNRWVIIDASQEIELVFQDIRKELETRLMSAGFIERPTAGKERY